MDSGEIVYLESNVQPDYSDLRFAGLDNTLYNYWIESTDSQSALIWVNITSIPHTGKQIYIYYGNNGAVPVSSGSSTFPVFDDFSGASIDTSRWTILAGNGNIYVLNGKLHLDYLGAQNNDWWSTARSEKILKLNSLPPGDDLEATIWLEPYTVYSNTQAGIGVIGSTDTSAYVFGRIWDLTGINGFRLDRLGTPGIASLSSTEIPALLKIKKTGNIYSFWTDSGSGWTKVGNDYSDVPFNAIVLFGKEWGTSNLNVVMDNFYVRPSVAIEPSHGSWGDQDVNP